MDSSHTLPLTEQYTGSISPQDEIHLSSRGKSKKKRTRIVGDQLDQLEHCFAMDRNPTAARRKEIGLQLGISERQIQFWFQNHRAKAKITDEKNKMRMKADSVAPPQPPGLSQSIQTKLEELIEEEDTSIFVIPCTDLIIGSWRRVNYGTPPNLLAWFCEKKRCFTWFVTSKEHSFKMQIPLEHISRLDFHNGDPGHGRITIDLIRTPGFYMRKHYLPHMSFSTPKSGGWRPCDDWTEHKEASQNLRHTIGGTALLLAYVVKYIKSQQPSFALRPSSYSHCPEGGGSSSSFALGSTSYLKPVDHHFSSIEDRRPMAMDWGTPSLLNIENQAISVQRSNDCKTYPHHNQPNRIGFANYPIDDARVCQDKQELVGMISSEATSIKFPLDSHTYSNHGTLP